MQPSSGPFVHVVEGDVPSLSDLYILELVGVKPPCLHASYSREHAKQPDLPTGHIHFPLQVELHVASSLHEICVFKNQLTVSMWYQRHSESRL